MVAWILAVAAATLINVFIIGEVWFPIPQLGVGVIAGFIAAEVNRK